MASKKNAGMQSKLSPPRLGRLVLRQRLFAKLDGMQGPVVTISGAPGVGKTVLIASYLARARRKSLWYLVDRSDNDPINVFTQLQSAWEGAPAFSKYDIQGAPDIEIVARNYFKAWFAMPNAPGHLVFDDFHESEHCECLQRILRAAIQVSEGRRKFYFVGRHIPLGPLVTLELHHPAGNVLEEDLRFTVEEARMWALEFSPQGRTIPDEDIERVLSLTRGWCAGFVLGLQDTALASSMPLVATPERIFDYLAEQVYARLHSHEREILIKVSFPALVSTDAAHSLSGNLLAGSTLDRLARHSLFTYRSQTETATYRFHPLLRQFLQRKARDSYTEEQLTQLILLSSRVSEQAGDVDDAASLLTSLKAWTALREFLVRQAPRRLSEGRFISVAGWIQPIPESMRLSDPWLLYLEAECAMPVNLELAYDKYHAAYRLIDRTDRNPEGLAVTLSGAVHSVVMAWGDFSVLESWIESGEPLFQEHAAQFRPEVQVRLTTALFAAYAYRRPHSPSLPVWMERAQTAIRAIPDDPLRLLLGGPLIHCMQVYCGAGTAVRDFLHAIQPRSEPASPLTTLLWQCFSAGHAWQKGDQSQAVAHSRRARSVVGDAGLYLWDTIALSHEIYAHLTNGEVAPVAALLDQMETSTRAHPRAIDVAHLHYLRSFALMVGGQVDQALSHIRRANEIADLHGGPQQWILGHLAACQAHLAIEGAEHFRSATAALSLVRGYLMNSLTRGPLEFQALLCEAALAIAKGDTQSEAKALAAAFRVQREFAVCNYPWFRPDFVSPLALRALELGIDVAAVGEFISHRRLLPVRPEWRWPIRIYTLGGLRIERNARAVTYGRKRPVKQLHILKALIGIARNVDVATRNNLGIDAGVRSTTLTQLETAVRGSARYSSNMRAVASTRAGFLENFRLMRKRLGLERAIAIRNDVITVLPSAVWVDCWALEDGLRAFTDPSRVHTSESVQKLNVPEGPDGVFLPELTDDSASWVRDVRERLKFLQRQYLEMGS